MRSTIWGALGRARGPQLSSPSFQGPGWARFLGCLSSTGSKLFLSSTSFASLVGRSNWKSWDLYFPLFLMGGRSNHFRPPFQNLSLPWHGELVEMAPTSTLKNLNNQPTTNSHPAASETPDDLPAVARTAVERWPATFAFYIFPISPVAVDSLLFFWIMWWFLGSKKTDAFMC